MFVHRTYGVVGATLGVLAMAGCGDPELNTSLRPEGPPDVLAVLVMTDAATQLVEKAVYCKSGDPLRPTLLSLPDFTTQQVCPEDGDPDPVTTAFPDGWYIRIMFDELLDPKIETLTPILDDDTGEETGNYSGSIVDAHPVSIECQSVVDNAFVNVDYDGYYSPSGNRVTWPLGPSLVIKPNDPKMIATNKQCRVKINPGVIFDKQGEEVPTADLGPYEFKIAPISVAVIDPEDDEKYKSPIDALQIYYENVYVQFNTEPDESSFCDDGPGMDECEFALSPETGVCSGGHNACDVAKGVMANPDCGANETCDFDGYYAYTYYPDGTRAEYGFGPVLPIQTGSPMVGATPAVPKQYSFFFKEGGKVKDRCGSETTFPAPDVDDLTLVRFAVKEFDVRGTTGLNLSGTASPSPIKKPILQMNNVVDFTSLDWKGTGAEWSITPQPYIAPYDEVTPCVTDDDCDATAFVDIAQLDQTAAGGQCRMFGNLLDGTPINGKRCVNLYATPLYNDGAFVFRGHYALDTTYTFTFKANATVKDFYGAVYTNPEELSITYKTQPAITLGPIDPADLADIDMTSPTDTTQILLPFGQSMDPTTLTEGDDFTLTPAVPNLDIGVGSTSLDEAAGPAPDCTESATDCELHIRGIFTPGDYKFTLKQGAMIKDVFGNTYTHPKDTVITFTVVDAIEPAVRCL